MIEDEKTWNECALDCPGMNKGKIWPVEVIEENRKKYVENIPLRREEVLELIKKEIESKE